MKKILTSLVFIAGFIGYAVYANASASNATAQAAVTTTDTPVSPMPAPISVPVSTPVTTPVVAPKKPVVATGQYTDGTYTGIAANAYYGNVQVKVAISGGKLTNVTFLQSPTDHSTSVYINQRAMPILRAEAIQAQSAHVDGVSGASDTSAAFVESLSSALAKA